jgi:hypothetical protein
VSRNTTSVPGAADATRSISTASAIEEVTANLLPKVRTAHRMIVCGEASSSRHAARRASASRCSSRLLAGPYVGIGLISVSTLMTSPVLRA